MGDAVRVDEGRGDREQRRSNAAALASMRGSARTVVRRRRTRAAPIAARSTRSGRTATAAMRDMQHSGAGQRQRGAMSASHRTPRDSGDDAAARLGRRTDELHGSDAPYEKPSDEDLRL